MGLGGAWRQPGELSFSDIPPTKLRTLGSRFRVGSGEKNMIIHQMYNARRIQLLYSF